MSQEPNPTNPQLDEAASAFWPPFTKEEMLVELYDALWSWCTGLALVFGEAPVYRLMSDPGLPSLGAHWLGSLELGATAEFVAIARQWRFVDVIARMYDFGMLGIAHDDMQGMNDESDYTYASAFILDMQESRMQKEIDAFSQGFFPSKALIAAQTAVARMILEGYPEVFYVFPGQGESMLTIRDMALLAKMEEKSLRNAANPKRIGHLQTKSINGSTYISPIDAKKWLMAKGRYLPILRKFGAADVDLAAHAFQDTTEAWSFIEARFRSLEMDADEFGLAAKESDLHESGSPLATSDSPLVNLNYEFGIDKARDQKLMKRFARVLQLPTDIFVLRMREAAAREELKEVLFSLDKQAASTRQQTP